MSDSIADLELIPKANRAARLAIVMSAGTLLLVMATALGFGIKIGTSEEKLATIQRDLVQKADKEAIEAKFNAIQEALSDIRRNQQTMIEREFRRGP